MEFYLSTDNDKCILAPSHRKYPGRRTPIVIEYKSLLEFGPKVISAKSAPEIDRLRKSIAELEKKRLEREKQQSL